MLNTFIKTSNKSKLIELFLTGGKRYRHEISKAIVYDTKTLDDGSKFIFRTPAEPTLYQLPPAINKPSVERKYHLSDKDISEMQQLRQEDPETWTRSKLAKKFDCSPYFVSQVTKAPESYHEKIEVEKTKKWQSMGFKRQLIYINRQRRRAQW